MENKKNNNSLTNSTIYTNILYSLHWKYNNKKKTAITAKNKTSRKGK